MKWFWFSEVERQIKYVLCETVMSKAPSPASVKTLTEMHHRTEQATYVQILDYMQSVRILILTFLECNLASGYSVLAHHPFLSTSDSNRD